MVEQIDPAATEMYLAHAEPGMKRTYAQRDWARLERALVEMETRLKGVIGDGQGVSADRDKITGVSVQTPVQVSPDE